MTAWPSAAKGGGGAGVAYHPRDHEIWTYMAARGHMHVRGGGGTTVVCALDPLRNKQPHILYERLDDLERAGARVFLLRAQASVDGEADEAAESEDEWDDTPSVVHLAASVLACEHFHITTVFTSSCEEGVLAPWRALFSCMGVSLLTYGAHDV